MSMQGLPEHIETHLQAPGMVRRVEDGFVDFRYYPDEAAGNTVFPGFYDGTEGFLSYPSTIEYFDDPHSLAPDQYGILHILKVTYADGSTEETAKVSIKPPTPFMWPPSKKATEWAQKIRANALTEIPEGR